ncbi:Porin [Candidatus Rhodobacter oscarellae]|uniref:Porin n=1 Tax=Candidatus Rhodobacter oscarellae TaxID=1675527 RepID=A0A0J9E7F0_9RHOB|nr:porin [Candidatus Rhodobacter lobularis]KMW58622.1 Porin [Candidatus Rhodobacter lobularis]
MKKVLFATTALVASAGIASAQGVELSGSAEMGVFAADSIDALGVFTNGEVSFFTDIDVTFTMSGETDNGLSFGASIDLDESDGSGTSGASAAFSPATQGGESIFISGDFGTLTMGDTDGAFDWAMTEVGIGGTLNDDHTSHAGFNGNATFDGSYDGQVARYDYSFDDFAFAVSAEIDDAGVGDAVFGIGATYSGDLGGVTLGVGLGYQQVGSRDAIGLSATAQLDSGFEARLNYSTYSASTVSSFNQTSAVDSHLGLGLGYSMDALTIGVNYGVFEAATAGEANHEGFGIAVDYDLGGGAVVQFGYGSSTVADASTAVGGDTLSAETWSLGVAMSF